MDDGVRATLAHGGRWVWFLIATFLWSIGIRLLFFLALLLFVLVPAVAYGGVAAVLGPELGVAIGLVAVLLTPVLLGAVGRRTGIGYPKLTVTLSFEAPDEGDDDGSSDPTAEDAVGEASDRTSGQRGNRGV